MSRSEILRMLKDFKENNSEKYDIVAIGLFGSTARDTINTNSDIDVVVKLKKQDLFNMIGIKQDLEEILHTHVDLISYRETMNVFLKDRINKEAVYI